MSTKPSANPAVVNKSFLKCLPTVRTHAQIQFRHLPADRREEAIAEATAAALGGLHQAHRNGSAGRVTPSTLAHYAVLHVKSGRHVGGSADSRRDVLSPRTQQLHGYQVFRLPLREGQPFNCLNAPDQPVWRDRLQFDRRTPPVGPGRLPDRLVAVYGGPDRPYPHGLGHVGIGRQAV